MEIAGTIHTFVTPYHDATGEIAWIKILNSGLAYGITHDGRVALISLKGTDSAEIRGILSFHETPEDMRTGFFKEQSNRRVTHY